MQRQAQPASRMVNLTVRWALHEVCVIPPYRPWNDDGVGARLQRVPQLDNHDLFP